MDRRPPVGGRGSVFGAIAPVEAPTFDPTDPGDLAFSRRQDRFGESLPLVHGRCLPEPDEAIDLWSPLSLPRIRQEVPTLVGRSPTRREGRRDRFIHTPREKERSFPGPGCLPSVRALRGLLADACGREFLSSGTTARRHLPRVRPPRLSTRWGEHRARLPATPTDHPGLGDHLPGLHGARRRSPTSATRHDCTSTPYGSSILARPGKRFAHAPFALPTGSPPCGERAPNQDRLTAPPDADSEPRRPCDLRGSRPLEPKDPRSRGFPSSKASRAPFASSTCRHGWLESTRRALADQGPRSRAAPRRANTFPRTEGAFRLTRGSA